MTYNRRVVAQIHRLGTEADVLQHEKTGTNEFGNPESEWTETGSVIVFRTYPNRNTEAQSRSGDLHRDRPVFLIPRDDFDETDDNPLPGNEDRLRYPSGTGEVYQLQAPTMYESHVEIFGEIVLNDSGIQ